jgi:hypothetical protein
MIRKAIGLCLALSAATGLTLAAALAEAPPPRLLLAQGEGAGAAELAALPANQWVVFAAPQDLAWRRQGHGSAAYDSKRGTLLLFGSNTHGENWDNSVHEFDPATKEWSTHYPEAARATYRADADGNRIAGPPDRLLPWAMHSYDNVLYDPKLDALVVTAMDWHNPIANELPTATVNPTWVYDLSTHVWRPLGNTPASRLTVFGGASAYDSGRDTLLAYGDNGATLAMFELGPARDKWVEVAPAKHQIHFNMDYDDRRGVMAVFGDWGDSSKVWIYRPGKAPGKMGLWEERVPEGDKCPAGQTFPVAFDKRAGVFLLVPRGVTCVYDPDANRYTILPEAKIPPLAEPYAMNYNMIYDERHGVFLVVTGEWQSPAVVWALRLDLGAL